MILFMMLTGSPPFGGQDERTILNNVRMNNIIFQEEDWAGMAGAENLVKHMIVSDYQPLVHRGILLSTPWVSCRYVTLQSAIRLKTC